ncbi:unnamed protein product [Candidula unifasciata]|uniref:DUF4587 domain-containing protein n=1 Tax=Candidula unifasciata TaxID=100452 RepID=A0A8S3ZEM7_9EUPU|nr:unnamed protein product [Candidula unifasciata]
MATDTESMRESVTRLHMRVVQQKLANERDKLQGPESEASDNGHDDEEIKIRRAVLKRQELLDQIQRAQLAEESPRTRTPRKRFSISSLSRRSLPNFGSNNHYHFGYYGNNRGMAQVKHVIEHQFRPAQPAALPGLTHLPAIQPFPSVVSPVATVQPFAILPHPVTPEVMPLQTLQPAYTWPALAIRDSKSKKDTMFNKGDFMDMMMLQNAQMHHMVMQQMMLHQLPGGSRPWTIPIAEPAAPVALMRPAPSIYHHHIGQPNYSMPPMDYRGGGGNGQMYGRNYNSTIYDDGSNYYHYH